jgi:hypothetical protein
MATKTIYTTEIEPENNTTISEMETVVPKSPNSPQSPSKIYSNNGLGWTDREPENCRTIEYDDDEIVPIVWGYTIEE